MRAPGSGCGERGSSFVGAVAALIGDKFGWMGGWAALCATAIAFYYSVVAGWCVRYLWAAVSGELARTESAAMWSSFTTRGTGCRPS